MIQVNKELEKKVEELVQQEEIGQAVILVRTITRCEGEEAQEYVSSVVVQQK
jgi:hypothetical protein